MVAVPPDVTSRGSDATALTPDELLRALRWMVLSRELDLYCEELEGSGQKVPNFHSGLGQEAMAVGAVLPLGSDDYFFYTHRGYAHLLAKGVSLEQIAGDLFFAVTGTNRGFGGVMHVCAPEHGILGRNGVFGSRFGIAAGVALACQLRAERRVVLCCYGEAEGTRGPFFEALNLATLWKLPVVFFAENNGFSISTRTDAMFAGGSMSRLWEGFPIPVTSVDGNSLQEVASAVRRAVERARRGEGPSLVEACTYRLSRHIPADRHDGIYRTAGEVRARWAEEPVGRLVRDLQAAGLVTPDQADALHRDARERVRAAIDAARVAPQAEPSERAEHVYWSEGRVA